jgi:hypothetical protein
MENYRINLSENKRSGRVILCFSLMVLLNAPFVKAQEHLPYKKKDSLDYSWERFSVSMGGFLTGLNSDIQIRSQAIGLGAILNVEEALGLETTSLVFRSEMEYNFGKRKRSTARLGYFSLLRKSTKVLETEIELGDQTFPVGTEMNSKYNLRIIKGTYEYSFFMDERVKMDASIGLYIMPISFSTSALDLSGEVAEFIAPLPVVGIGTSFAINPKFYFIQQIDLLYLKIDTYKGSIINFIFKCEYKPWNHIGFGLGLNAHQLTISAFKENGSFLDFNGSVKTGYTGLLIYGKYYL